MVNPRLMTIQPGGVCGSYLREFTDIVFFVLERLRERHVTPGRDEPIGLKNASPPDETDTIIELEMKTYGRAEVESF